MKTCKTCSKDYPITDYDHDKNGKISRHTCKWCRNSRRSLMGSRSGTGYKNYRLNYQYGISLDTYEQMSKNQNGLCKICKRESLNQWGTKLVVDHCHKTGKVRGLLCDKCNKGLGQFEDSIDSLETSIKYLKGEL